MTPLMTTTPKTIAHEMVQDCIARRLRQVNRMVTRLYDEALRELGLTVNQLNILATIISQGQIQPGQLGKLLGMEKSTVSRTIDRMVNKGWLEVNPGKDGRSQLLKATQYGRQLLVKAAPVWDQLQDSVLGGMEATSGEDSQGMSLLALLSGNPQPTDNETSDPEVYSDDDFAADFYS